MVKGAVKGYVTRKPELIEIQKQAAKHYTEGNLSFDELVYILGYEKAKKVACYKDIAEVSFAQGLSSHEKVSGRK